MIKNTFLLRHPYIIHYCLYRKLSIFIYANVRQNLAEFKSAS
jgi:hypothetical protein